ncbi:Uncharacterised protein [uncultured archaeon]|nr:Uncharacterised protein [uncultured archaeon]
MTEYAIEKYLGREHARAFGAHPAAWKEHANNCFARHLEWLQSAKPAADAEEHARHFAPALLKYAQEEHPQPGRRRGEGHQWGRWERDLAELADVDRQANSPDVLDVVAAQGKDHAHTCSRILGLSYGKPAEKVDLAIRLSRIAAALPAEHSQTLRRTIGDTIHYKNEFGKTTHTFIPSDIDALLAAFEHALKK